MGVSPGDPDENVYERHQELCVKLNMDKDTADEAWQNYERIKENYLLEVSIATPRVVFICVVVYKLVEVFFPKDKRYFPEYIVHCL